MQKLILSAFMALLSTGIAFGQCPLTFNGGGAATVGVYIAPVKGGSITVDYNSAKLMTPASVMKAVTVAAALSRYGGDYRWITTVGATGRVSEGTLSGNITLKGSGDPTLGSDFFKERQSFLTALKAAASARGINRVEGSAVNVRPWPEEGPVSSWELEDIPGVDGAGFYSLNYSDNVFVLSYPSMKTSPTVPGLKVSYMGGTGGLRFYRDAGSREVTIYGKLGRKQTRASFKCSMPDPPAVLLNEVNRTLNAAKGKVSASTDTMCLLEYKSPALRDVARSLMVRSDNQMAEATLRLLAPRCKRSKAIETERELLSSLSVNLKTARIADGSGLSRHNAISPRQLGEVLRVMACNEDYVGSFARVGLDGTVRNFMRGVPGRENFVLKSGSMTGVVCYVGYRLDPDTKSPTHVIAIMVNNAPNAAAARNSIAFLLSNTQF